MWAAQRVVVFHPGPFPRSISYPTARPAMVMRDLGADVHVVEIVGATDAGNRDLDGTTVWSETSRRAALQRVARLRPQLLMVEGATWPLLALPLARHSWVRATEHSPRPDLAALERLLMRKATYVSFVSPAEAAWWSIRPDRVVELPYPVDLAFWSAPVEPGDALWRDRGIPPPVGHVVSYAAQLMPRKRQVELVAALAPLLRDRHDVCIAVAGDTVDPATETELRRIADEHGLADRVHLLGGLCADELRQLYVRSTIHAVNSAYETQCMVVYESLAAGTATVIPDLATLTSAFPGLPAHRSDGELRDNIAALLDDADLRQRTVDSAQERLPWADVSRHDASCRAVAARLL